MTPSSPAVSIASPSVSLMTEELVSFAEACELFPGRNGRRVNAATVWRWRTVGVRLPDGRVVKLAAIRCGTRWWTSRQAINRFIAAQNVEAGVGPARDSAKENARQDCVARQLDEELGKKSA